MLALKHFNLFLIIENIKLCPIVSHYDSLCKLFELQNLLGLLPLIIKYSNNIQLIFIDLLGIVFIDIGNFIYIEPTNELY